VIRPIPSRSVLAALLLAALGSREAARAATSAGVQPLVAGQPAPGEGAVVSLVDGKGRLRCSGVLVAPDVVLTAGHCADGSLLPAACAWSGGAAGSGRGAAVVAAALHPDYAGPDGPAEADLGLLLLDRAPGPAPFAIRPTDLDETAVGAAATVYGFGRTAPGAPDEGVRRVGQSVVTAVTGATVEIGPAPAQPCILDSGGPACLGDCATAGVAALVSRGDASCAGRATLARVDVRREFVARQIDAWRSTPRTGAATCPGLDADLPSGCGQAGAGPLGLLLAGAALLRVRARPATARASRATPARRTAPTDQGI